MTRVIFQVEGMHCEKCVKTIENGLNQFDGISAVSASLKNKAVTIDYNPEKVTEEALRKEIEDLGYDVPA
ncbi:MAG: cation transporter [Zymomonas mobilis]|uniref:Copper chaperone n=1 Tax=Zymomonas mobilis TaxID=542 RepID=A0A542W170_ZYMMB|nr:cation transporter [Zymomonas mobilis]TQL17331.1 copper chaperone [Zymomonas mobilis]